MPQNPDYTDKVRLYAKRYEVPEDLALQVMQQESRGHHYRPNGSVVTSDQGALGLFQLLPGTARRFGVDATIPEDNIKGGVKYLRFLSDKFNGDYSKILAGYHSGEDDAEAALANPNGNPRTAAYVATGQKSLAGSLDSMLAAAQARQGGPNEDAAPETPADIRTAATESQSDPAFQSWYKDRAQRLGLNPNPDDPAHHYDYRAAFQAGAEPDASGHWPSKFKTADHPNRFVMQNGQRIDSITGKPAPEGDASELDTLLKTAEARSVPAAIAPPMGKSKPKRIDEADLTDFETLKASAAQTIADENSRGLPDNIRVGQSILEKAQAKALELQKKYGADSLEIGGLGPGQAPYVKPAPGSKLSLNPASKQKNPAEGLMLTGSAQLPNVTQEDVAKGMGTQIGARVPSFIDRIVEDYGNKIVPDHGGISPQALVRWATVRREEQQDPGILSEPLNIEMQMSPWKKLQKEKDDTETATAARQDVLNKKSEENAKHGAVINFFRHIGSSTLAGLESGSGSLLQGAGYIAREKPGQGFFTPAGEALSSAGKNLQQTSGGEDFLSGVAHSAGQMAPVLVGGLPGFVVGSGLQKIGEGGSPLEGIKAGAEAAVVGKLGGELSSLVPPTTAPFTSFLYRTVANAAAPMITNAALHGQLPTTPEQIGHDLMIGAGFAAHGHSVEGFIRGIERKMADGKAMPAGHVEAYQNARDVLVMMNHHIAEGGELTPEQSNLYDAAGKAIEQITAHAKKNGLLSPEQMEAYQGAVQAQVMYENRGKGGKGVPPAEPPAGAPPGTPGTTPEAPDSPEILKRAEELYPAIIKEITTPRATKPEEIGQLPSSRPATPEDIANAQQQSLEQARAQIQPKGEPNANDTTIPGPVGSEPVAGSEANPSTAVEAKGSKNKPEEKVTPTAKPSEIADKIDDNKFVVRSDDGRFGVIQLGKDGRAQFNEVTAKKSLDALPPVAGSKLSASDFDSLFPRNAEGYVPGSIEDARARFVKDEKLLPSGQQPLVSEPAKTELKTQKGESNARQEPEIHTEAGQTSETHRGVGGETRSAGQNGEADRLRNREQTKVGQEAVTGNAGQDQLYADAVEHVQRAKYATPELLARKLNITHEEGRSLLNRMADEGIVRADEKGRLFLIPTKGGKANEGIKGKLPTDGRQVETTSEAGSKATGKAVSTAAKEEPVPASSEEATARNATGDVVEKGGAPAPTEAPPQTAREKFEAALKKKRDEKAQRVESLRAKRAEQAAPVGKPPIERKQSENKEDGRIRELMGLDQKKIDTYDPIAAVSKSGKRWTYQTYEGNDHPSSFDTKKEAIEAATQHKTVKQEQMDNPSAFFDLTRLKASLRLKDIEASMRAGMSEMEAGKAAQLAEKARERKSGSSKEPIREQSPEQKRQALAAEMKRRLGEADSEGPDYSLFNTSIREPLAPYNEQLSRDDYDRVVAKLDHLKDQAKESGQPLSKAIDEYLRQGGLFGKELNEEQQALLKKLALRGRKSAVEAEQGALFESSPTIESRREQSQIDKAGPTLFDRRSRYGTGEGQDSLFQPGVESKPGVRREEGAVQSKTASTSGERKVDLKVRRAIREFEKTPHRATYDNLAEDDSLDSYDEQTLNASLSRVATEVTQRGEKSYFIAKATKPLPETRPDYSAGELDQYRANLGRYGNGEKGASAELAARDSVKGIRETEAEYDAIPLPHDVKQMAVDIARSFLDEGKTDFDKLVNEFEDLLGSHFDKISDHLPAIVDRAEAEQKSEVRSQKSEKIDLSPGKPEDTAEALGKTSRAVTPRGMEVETRFALVNADKPITSHDRFGNPNPHFPEGVQNRDRGKVSSKDQQNNLIAKFEPAHLGENIEAGSGAPIVGHDWAVESGNGRVNTLRAIYAEHPKEADKYKAWLTKNAEKFGLTGEQVNAVDQPLLVRIRSTELSPAERIQFAEQANEDTQLKLSPVEVARGDGRKLGSLIESFHPDEEGNILTPANRPFISSFLDKIVGPSRGDLITADGQLSQSGIQRIRNAIFAAAYGDTDAGIQSLEKLAESTDVNIKRVINSMVFNASRFAKLKEDIAAGARYPLDLAPDLAKAAHQLSVLREQGRTVDEHLQQMGLFGETMSVEQKKLLYVLDENKNSARALNGIIGNYLNGVEALGDPRQESFFTAKGAPTKDELLEAAVKEYEYGQGEQGGIFDTPEGPAIGGDRRGIFDAPKPIEPRQGGEAAPVDSTPEPKTAASPEPGPAPKPKPAPRPKSGRKANVSDEPQPGETRGRDDGGGDGRTSISGTDRIITARSHLTNRADESVIPGRLERHLEPHQRQGVALAVDAMDKNDGKFNHGGFLLADGTGAGKTREILATAEIYRERGHPVLIVAPNEVLKPDWDNDRVQGSYHNDSRAMGIEYGLAKGKGEIGPGISLSTYHQFGELKIPKNTVVVFDEAQSLKNSESARSIKGRQLAADAHAVLYASATPADKPTHLEYLFRAGILENKSADQMFKDLGLIRRVLKEGKKGERVVWEIDPSIGTTRVLKRMNDLFGRLTNRGQMVKREISMKDVSIEFKRLELPPEAQKTMADIEKGFGGLSNANGLKKAVILMHQRRQQEPYKIDLVAQMVKEEMDAGRQPIVYMSRINPSEAGQNIYKFIGGEKVKVGREVYAQSEGTAPELRKALAALGINDVAELHGAADTSAAMAIDDFNSGRKPAMIATIESGGTGINLDDTVGDRPRTLIVMTAPFSGMDNVQVAGRVWRLSSKSAPKIRYIFSDLPIDKWNQDIIAGKMKAVGATVEGEVKRLDVPEDFQRAPADSIDQSMTPDSGRIPRAPKQPVAPPLPAGSQPAAPAAPAAAAGPAERETRRSDARLATLGIPETVKEDLIPRAQAAVQAFAKEADNIRATFAAPTRGEAAQTTANIIRGHVSEIARGYDQAENALRVAEAHFDRNNYIKGQAHYSPEIAQLIADGKVKERDAYNIEFMHRVETGQKQLFPDVQEYGDTMRDIMDHWRKQIQDLGTGKLQNYYLNYFPHIWKDPTEARKMVEAFYNGKRPLEGPKTFLKKRSHPTIADGLAAGLELVSTNPVDAVLLKTREMQRFWMGQKTFEDMKRLGLAEFLPPDYHKTGWKKIPDPMGTVYGSPYVDQIHQEAFDKHLMKQLDDVATAIGVDHERLVNLGRGKAGVWGFTGKGQPVTTRFGGPESVYAHEIGHQIGYKYGVFDRLWNNPVDDTRRQIKSEWRALADLRFEDVPATDTFKKYVRNAREKEAVLLEAYIHAPDRFRQVAPMLYGEFENLLKSHKELAPILDIKKSLVLDSSSQVTQQKLDGIRIVGHWWAPETAANILENYLSPGLREKSGAFRAVLGATSVLNSAQLGISAYHGGFVTVEAAASKAALGIEQLIAGQTVHGLSSIGQSLVPGLSAITTAREGRKLYKAWMQNPDANPELAQIMEAIHMSGHHARMDEWYRTNMVRGMQQAFRKGQIAGGIFRLPFAGLEVAAKPILEHYVPWMKMGVIADMLRADLAKTAGQNLTHEQLAARFAKASDSTDNRLGQMIYDNLFLPKTAKDLGMVMIRSLGWNVGTWREIGGAGVDGIKAVNDLFHGRRPEFTHRMAYTLALPMVVGFYGALLHYMYNGKGPDEMKDYFFPKTGRLDSNGNPERVSLPSYLKDVVHMWMEPGRTLKNKLNPIVTLVGDMVSNEDYFGKRIRNQDDPWVKQALQMFEHTAEQFVPIGVRNMLQARKSGESLVNQALPAIGITRTPSRITKTPLQEKLAEEAPPRGSRTQAQYDRIEAMTELRRKARGGQDVTAEALKLAQKGTIRNADVVDLARGDTSLERQFKSLPVAEALKLYTTFANPKEKQTLQPIVQSKLHLIDDLTGPDHQKAIDMAKQAGFDVSKVSEPSPTADSLKLTLQTERARAESELRRDPRFQQMDPDKQKRAAERVDRFFQIYEIQDRSKISKDVAERRAEVKLRSFEDAKSQGRVQSVVDGALR